MYKLNDNLHYFRFWHFNYEYLLQKITGRILCGLSHLFSLGQNKKNNSSSGIQMPVHLIMMRLFYHLISAKEREILTR